MSPPITAAEIEHLCGRPGAFAEFVGEALAGHPQVRVGEFESARLWGHVGDGISTLVWIWPWPPEGPHQAWDVIEAPELRPLRSAIRAASRYPQVRLHVIVARLAKDPGAWVERLTARLRATIDNPTLQVVLEGPDALASWAAECGSAISTHWFRAARALAARGHDYAECERALMTVLDRGPGPEHAQQARAHWSVVADELQRRGDPTGESLALALAPAPGRPSHNRSLSRAYLDREAWRMARAPRTTQMLAFVGLGGVSCAIDEFEEPAGGSERGSDVPVPPTPRDTVRIWAERVGPFFVRILTQTADPNQRGLGLPESLWDAPELRYLSASRISSIHPDATDLSSQDLSGFDLTGLAPSPTSLIAYETSLRGCDLRRADLSSWQLLGADLRGAIAGPETRFEWTNLAAARISPALAKQLERWNAFGPSGERPHGPAYFAGAEVVPD